MRTTIPTPGTNELTRRLLAQGVRLDDPNTWPDNVWACQQNAFAFSRQWKHTPTWESPCGLLIHKFGDHWGETWIEGEFKCAENFNPLFECPRPGTPCPHRKKLPRGINCQFHETDREWTEEASCERLYKMRDEQKRALWEEDLHKYPGFNGVCVNVKEIDTEDGGVMRQYRYDLNNCVNAFRCQSTQCICRLGAERDLRPVNIFYDVYTEREIVDGFLEYTEKEVLKGLKVFEKPVARTDAELALKMWQHDPDNPIVPSQMMKLNASRHFDGKEEFFVLHHGQYNGRIIKSVTTEIQNIHIAKNEQRDMLADLQAVQDGIEVKHDGDLKKAAEAAKKARRASARVAKSAKIYANELRNGARVPTALWGKKDEEKAAIKEEAARILVKEKAKAEKERKAEAARAAQMSLLDLQEETGEIP